MLSIHRNLEWVLCGMTEYFRFPVILFAETNLVSLMGPTKLCYHDSIRLY